MDCRSPFPVLASRFVFTFTFGSLFCVRGSRSGSGFRARTVVPRQHGSTLNLNTNRAVRSEKCELLHQFFWTLKTKVSALVSFAPMVTVCVWVPSFSCHASMV